MRGTAESTELEGVRGFALVINSKDQLSFAFDGMVEPGVLVFFFRGQEGLGYEVSRTSLLLK